MKISVTQINAGTQHNVVPDRCTFVADIRTTDAYSNPETLDLFRAAEPFGSPTLSDQALMPWQSLKLGPGDSARSHTADEYILLSEIRDAIALYTTLLDGLNLSSPA